MKVWSASMVALLAICGTAAAQPEPLGLDFQVNTLTAGYNDGADIGVAANGDFVVVWQSPESAGSDTHGTSIQARRYTEDGTALGAEFQVNTFTTATQLWPAVAVAPSGAFVVAWESDLAADDPYGWSIQGQLFDSSGGPVGEQFQANSFTFNDQQEADVAMDSLGNFMVVWHSWADSTGSDSHYLSIQGQRFSSSGQRLSDQFQVNTSTTYQQYYPSVAAGGPDRDFVVVWHSDSSAGTDSDAPSVQGQRFASTGGTIGGEFQVNSYTTGYQYHADVAVNALGDFVVVWQDGDYFGNEPGIDGDGLGIVARQFSSSGTPFGPEVVVNSYTTSDQVNPSVGFDADGRFVVVWDSEGSPGSDTSYESIQGQQFHGSGVAIGGQFQVNSYTTARQYGPSVAFSAGQSFVISWTGYASSGTDTHGSSTQARRLLVDVPIFADGFESGDTSAWFSSVP